MDITIQNIFVHNINILIGNSEKWHKRLHQVAGWAASSSPTSSINSGHYFPICLVFINVVAEMA